MTEVEVVAEEDEEEGVAEAVMVAASADKAEAMGEHTEVVTAAALVEATAAAMAEVMVAATAETEKEITTQAAVSGDAEEVVDGVEAVDVVVEEAEVVVFVTNFSGRVRVRLGISVDFPTAKTFSLSTHHLIHQRQKLFIFYSFFTFADFPSFQQTSLEERQHFDSIKSYNESPFTFGKSFSQVSQDFSFSRTVSHLLLSVYVAI